MIWIVGADGLVGRALQKYLKDKGIDFIASQRKDADITDLGRLKQKAKEIQPSYIFNCAAYTLVDSAETERDQAEKINRDGPENLATIATDIGSHLIHISTDYVFSKEQERPFTETDPTAPVNHYGWTKLEGEKKLLSLMPSACVVRTSWVYGPKGKNFISSLVQLFQTQEVVEACFDQVGKPTYSMDLAQALYELKDASGIFHFAGGLQGSRYEIAKTIFLYMKSQGMPLKCKQVVAVSSDTFKTKAQRPKYSVLDTSKFEQTVHRKPLCYSETFTEMFS